MGFLRKGALIVVCNLFLISILIGNLFLVISISLKYENIKEKLNPIVSDLVKDPVSDYVLDYCEKNSEFVFQGKDFDLSPYLFSYDVSLYVSYFDNDSVSASSFNISCEGIENEMDAIIEENVDNAIEQIYYKDYDCAFWDCLKKESPLFLISEKSRAYWRRNFYFSLVVSFVLFFLMFLLVKEKPNSLILAGSLMIVSSLPFAKLDWLFSRALGKYGLSFEFLSGFSNIFLKILIIGIIVLGAGIVLRVLKVSLKFLSKEKQQKTKTKTKK